MKNKNHEESGVHPGKKASALRLAFTGIAATAVAIGYFSTSASAKDYVLIVPEEQTLETVVENQLSLSEFANQIAAYNGIDSTATMLPVGTALQIPDTYIRTRQSGRVVFAKGDVTHTQQTRVANPPVKGTYVFKGDVFTTGENGFVSLSFNSDSVVNVQPESRVSIENVECHDETVSCIISLNAETGEIHSAITPRADGEPPVKFSVTTPFLSAAVRGTSFYVSVDKDENLLGVTDGLVAADVNGSANEVPKGKGLVAKTGVAPDVVDLLVAPAVEAGSAKTIYSAEDQLRWQTLNDAEQYRVVFASDQAMTQLLYSASTQGTVETLPVDVPGEYYATVAGIDNKGFVGLPASVNFSFASIDDNEGLELDIQRQEDTIEIAALDYSGKVELVISNSVDSLFSERRIVDDMTNGLTLGMNPDQDWVVQARKVFSDTSVSAYGYQYLLSADR